MHYEVMILCVNLLLFCEFLFEKNFKLHSMWFLRKIRHFSDMKKNWKKKSMIIMGGYKMNIFNAYKTLLITKLL
jgi:hypothetical protein